MTTTLEICRRHGAVNADPTGCCPICGRVVEELDVDDPNEDPPKIIGVSSATIRRRLEQGWTTEKISEFYRGERRKMFDRIARDPELEDNEDPQEPVADDEERRHFVD